MVGTQPAHGHRGAGEGAGAVGTSLPLLVVFLPQTTGTLHSLQSWVLPQ